MVKQYIPFTKARRQRLFALGLHGLLGDDEALLQVEWPDGTETFVTANFNDELSAWETENESHFYSRGVTPDVSYALGVPIVHVDANNAGVVSKLGAMFATREHHYDYVDAEGEQLEVTATDDDGVPTEVEYADSGEPVAADGGEVDLYYHYDGEVIDRKLGGLVDPVPVSREQADQAVQTAKNAMRDPEGSFKRDAMLVGGGVGIVLVVLGFIWLLGQIGGGGGGSGGGASISFMISALGWL